MSQITRCPACETLFKVVPDQLRISQGWVRCGQCQEVFDALENLREPVAVRADAAMAPPLNDQAAPASESAAQSSPGEAVEPQPEPQVVDDLQAETPAREPEPDWVDAPAQWLPSAQPDIPITDPAASLDAGFAEYQQAQAQTDESAPATPIDRAMDAEPMVPTQADQPAVESDMPAPERLFVAITSDAIAQPERVAAREARPLPQRASAPESTPLPSMPSAPAPLEATTTWPAHGPAPATVDVSFLREGAGAAPLPNARRSQRAVWITLVVVLLLALGAQVALHTRDRLAAAAPALQPVLQALCAPLNCSVQPLRRIDAVVIDGSAFMALGDLGYRLSLTLRNRASHAVALPALVLSLTDIQEQAVVRRVLLPDELGTPPSSLPAHGEWSTSVDLQMADNAGRARVVGYRLDAFYP